MENVKDHQPGSFKDSSVLESEGTLSQAPPPFNLISAPESPPDNTGEDDVAMQRQIVQPIAKSGNGDGPIQREVIPHRETADADQVNVKAFVTSLNAAMQGVWAQLISRKLKTTEEGLDGYTGRWQTLLTAYLDNPSTRGAGMIPAAFGYAMESVTCKLHMPAIGGGLTIHLQETRGNTRPDIVVKKEGTDIAWLDLTASKSEDHVLDKSGSGWSSKPHVYEVTYPSISGEMIKTMIEKNPNGADLSLNDVEREYYLRQAREQYKLKVIKSLILMDINLGLDQEKSSMYDSNIRKRVQKDIKRIIDVSIGPKDTANILACLGKNPMYYGFRKSGDRFSGRRPMYASLSASEGEAILLSSTTGEPRPEDVMNELKTLNPTIHGQIVSSTQ